MIGDFLKSEVAVSLTPETVAQMNKKQVRAAFQEMRWPETSGRPICPKCESREIYNSAKKVLYKCKACKHQFSVTSSTVFAGHKMPLKNYLMAIALVMHKRANSLSIAGEMDVQYGTAYRLSLAIRSQLASAASVADERGLTRAACRANERCKRCDRSRRELSKFPNNPTVTGVSFCHGYCPKCYQLRLAYKQDEELCDLHELTQTLKQEIRDARHH